LIENKEVLLSPEDVDWLLRRHAQVSYPCFIQKNFHNIYYTDEENYWLDQTITNIHRLSHPYKFALAFFALCQACLVKRPYNLFHRKNLYLRQARVKRSFGNKTTWDRPFEAWFRAFVEEANRAVFDNGQPNQALNLEALEVPGHYDLVYIDTPYISSRGTAVDYLDFYHFLEGLALYDRWAEHIDRNSKHRRFKRRRTAWTDKKEIYSAFDRLFQRYRDSIIVLSYRSDGIPSEAELVALLKQYKRRVQVEHFGQYKYALSTNAEVKEMLLIGI
jgi:DNA adenine methylase/adenine-specific DNA-methyltransferase